METSNSGIEIPDIFASRFVRGEQIGKGASCRVFKATDKELGDREIALKIFIDQPHGKPELIEQFERETAFLREVSHSSLIPIIKAGCEDDWFYMAMELIEGPTLRDTLKSLGGPMDMDKVLYVAKDIADGLKEIHEHGTVHAHLDSRAILFKGEQVRIGGFYPPVIGKILRGVTSASRLIVDPAYISPEQVLTPDEIDFRADIYTLAILVYEMATGEKPFTAANPLQLAMLRTTQAPPSAGKANKELSPIFSAALQKGLAKDPAERFQSLDDFFDALTGGKGFTKNPLEGADVDAPAGDRLTTETIAVSMSTDQLKGMLAEHTSKPEAKPAPKVDADSTMMGAKAVNGGSAAEAEPMDVAATVMGMPAQETVRGSFIVLEGKRRGTRYQIDKSQWIIGGDRASDVIVDDKGVPARYAIVTQRGDSYFVGPLSPAGITVNDELYEGADDLPLQRGDTITAGKTKLRFIAPGEVFTFQEDAADRVIDRPESKSTKIVMVIALFVVALAAVGMFYYQGELSSKKEQIAAQKKAKAKKRQEIIAGLIQEGDALFKQGALVEPVGANAREKFQKVLEYNPDDLYAKRRLDEIEKRLVESEAIRKRREQARTRIAQLFSDGEKYFQEGHLISPPGSNARDAYREILRLDRTNEEAKERIKEIEQILGDLVGRVNSMLAKAQVYIDLGQFTEPRGENALELVREVLKIDADNEKAKNALYDMAAFSVFEGDRAKSRANVAAMKKSYLTAQALGVSPKYLKPRIEGAKLIEKSRSSVIIYQRGEDGKKADEDTSGKYLDTEEIERRVATLQLKHGKGGSSPRVFIDLGR